MAATCVPFTGDNIAGAAILIVTMSSGPYIITVCTDLAGPAAQCDPLHGGSWAGGRVQQLFDGGGKVSTVRGWRWSLCGGSAVLSACANDGGFGFVCEECGPLRAEAPTMHPHIRGGTRDASPLLKGLHIMQYVGVRR